MTKKDIIKTIGGELSNTRIHLTPNSISNAMDMYSKQQAIEFSQFIYKSEWRQYNDNGWFNGDETDVDLITTEQLYELFLKQQDEQQKSKI